MLSGRTLWLAVNASSGSNDEAALAALQEAFGGIDCTVARTVSFPEDDPPTPAELDAADIDVLAVFTGDGSLNAMVTALYGWRGSVLVLPGGTIMLTPTDARLEGDGYYAETIADYAKQSIALLRRNFRDGPHDGLGLHREFELTCPEGEPMGLLIDGEPADGEVTERFTISRCEVDLVGTIDG